MGKGVKKYNCTLIYSLLFTLLSTHAFAQKVIIHGNIKNKNNQEVPFAVIQFKEDSLSLPRFYCIANSEGAYTLVLKNNNLKKGILEIVSLGYNKLLIPILIDTNDLVANALLVPIINKLPDVLIKADPSIKKNGDTTTFKVSAFVKGNEQNLGNLLSNMPGFQVKTTGKITYNGKPIDKILIENDDLTGSNYETITNHLGISGIENVEVIDNFKDNENIISSFFNNTQKQVLNLKYSKTKLLKLFGETELGLGFSKKHIAKAQLISLINKTKAIVIGGTNNTGILTSINDKSTIQQPSGDLNDISTIDKPLLAPLSSVAYINELNNFLTNNISTNNSSFVSSNFLLRPFKNCILKIKSNYNDDTFLQNQTAIKINYLPDSIITSQNSQANNYKIKGTNGGFFFNYLKKRSQVCILLDVNKLNTNTEGNGFLQGNTYNHILENSFTIFDSRITFSQLLKNNFAVSCQFQYSQQSLNGTYKLLPSAYSSYFLNSIGFKNIYQPELQNLNSCISSIRLLKKIKSHSLSLIVKQEYNNAIFSNNILIENQPAIYHAIGQDSINRLDLINNNLTIKFEDFFKINSCILFSYSLEFLNRHFYLNKQNNLYCNNLYISKIYPSASIAINLSKSNRLYLSLNSQNKLPQIKDFGSGYKIGGLTDISRGNDTLVSNNTQNLSITFSHFDFSKKNNVFFAGLIFQKLPYNFIGNQNPNLYYTLYNYSVSNKNLSLLSSFFRMDKFSKNLKYRFSPEINISSINIISMVQSKEYQNNNIALKLGLNCSYKFSNNLQITGLVEYKLSGTGTIEKINSASLKNKETQLSLDFLWQASSRLFIAQKNTFSMVSSSGQPKQQLFLSDFSLKYIIKKEKLSVEASCNNLLNTTSFSNYLISPTQTNINNYYIFPRIGLLKIKYTL